MNMKFAALPTAVALTLLLAACGGDPAPPAAAVSSEAPAAVSSEAAAPSSAAAQPDQEALQRAAQEAAAQAAAAAAARAAASSSEPVLVAQADTSSTPAPAASSEPAPAASSEPPPPGAAANQSAPSGTAGVPAAGTPQQNWLKICDPLDNGQSACIMRQVVMSSNNQFLGSFLLRDDPGQESRLLAVAAVPLGVLLPFGLTWQIDGGKPVRVPYMLCDPQSCASQLVINEAYVNSLKKGGVLKLTAKNRRNEDLTITINLGGFTGVYDGEAALTFDEFAKNASGEAALEKILQDRAEAARQERGATSSAPATP